MKTRLLLMACLFVLLASVTTSAQQTSAENPPENSQNRVKEIDDAIEENNMTGDEDSVDNTTEKIKDQVDEISKKVNESERAQEISAGILQPIYKLADTMSYPWFYWLAFTVMVIGVVSFAFQLVLGKLVVLLRGSISLTEILSDAIGLIISLVGLVLTTQAATQNSSFPKSPAAVLSATIVGAVFGLLFYLWGQRQELRAAAAKRLSKEIS